MNRSERRDDRNFTVLFEENYEQVARYARRRTQPELVDETVAETFLVAWRKRTEVPEDPLPWLLGVARRVLSTQRRSAQRRSTLLRRLMELRGRENVERITAVEQDGLVSHALAQLPELDREAILLIAWEGLTTAQAAQVVGVSDVAMRARISRARKRFRSELVQLETDAESVDTADRRTSVSTKEDS